MAKLENDMIRWGRLLFERRLISGWGGNLSCRAGKNNFLITGQHAPLAFLTPKDLVRLNSDGKPVRKQQRASSETPMHMAVYSGTDAQAIVHVHPPMVLAFSLTHESFVPVSFEEKYTIGEVPIIAQDTPTVTKPEKVVEALQISSGGDHQRARHGGHRQDFSGSVSCSPTCSKRRCIANFSKTALPRAENRRVSRRSSECVAADGKQL